jgi:hypothetical protein
LEVEFDVLTVVHCVINVIQQQIENPLVQKILACAFAG